MQEAKIEEDPSSRPDWAKSVQDPISTNIWAWWYMPATAGRVK
jgi:hypothetical protein